MMTFTINFLIYARLHENQAQNPFPELQISGNDYQSYHQLRGESLLGMSNAMIGVNSNLFCTSPIGSTGDRYISPEERMAILFEVCNTMIKGFGKNIIIFKSWLLKQPQFLSKIQEIKEEAAEKIKKADNFMEKLFGSLTQKNDTRTRFYITIKDFENKFLQNAQVYAKEICENEDPVSILCKWEEFYNKYIKEFENTGFIIDTFSYDPTMALVSANKGNQVYRVAPNLATGTLFELVECIQSKKPLKDIIKTTDLIPILKSPITDIIEVKKGLLQTLLSTETLDTLKKMLDPIILKSKQIIDKNLAEIKQIFAPYLFSNEADDTAEYYRKDDQEKRNKSTEISREDSRKLIELFNQMLTAINCIPSIGCGHMLHPDDPLCSSIPYNAKIPFSSFELSSHFNTMKSNKVNIHERKKSLEKFETIVQKCKNKSEQDPIKDMKKFVNDRGQSHEAEYRYIQANSALLFPKLHLELNESIFQKQQPKIDLSKIVSSSSSIKIPLRKRIVKWIINGIVVFSVFAGILYVTIILILPPKETFISYFIKPIGIWFKNLSKK